MEREKRKEEYRIKINHILMTRYFKEPKDATKEELFYVIAQVTLEDIANAWTDTQNLYRQKQLKTLYYFSMEFLPGRILGNNLMNFGLTKVVEELMEEYGVTLNEMEDEESDPGLGNGGLGRLAACFLECISTLGYPACGCGILYKNGLFRQKIVDGQQEELPDQWQKEKYPIKIKRKELEQIVSFRDMEVRAIPHDIPVVGYGNRVVNTLRLWDAKPMDSANVSTDEYRYCNELTNVLYPNDDKTEGKILRLSQQYFFVSASLQQIVKAHFKQYKTFQNFSEKVVFQLNDTHPTLVIPELMRILMHDYLLKWEEAWAIVTKSCAFTNHTIMAEAMEKWDISLFEGHLPDVYRIVEEIHRRFAMEIRTRYPNDEEKVKKMAILYDGQVRMANMAIASAFSVNGVAALHTEILKSRELKAFYEMMPGKFNNKTNGVTQRRFVTYANPELSKWIGKKCGYTLWYLDMEKIKKIEKHAYDSSAQTEFMEIKRKNKEELADYIKKANKITVNPDSIFDTQIKRIHEYKRQFMNILRVMYLYNELKEHPEMDFYPMTFIFAGKAHASYKRAKQIIRLIHSVANMINHDPEINGKIKVVFLENYCVSLAELIIPGSDVSEQISTASKEASGTGNMKFMMNGALTLGTLDGANVEIRDAVGEENMFLFGMNAEEVMEYEKNGTYISCHICLNNPKIEKVLEQLIDGTYVYREKDGSYHTFADLRNSLIYGSMEHGPADRYFVLKDLPSYIDATLKLNLTYQNQNKWAEMAIMNVANSYIFSADRTIEEYNRDIWHLEPYYAD